MEMLAIYFDARVKKKKKLNCFSGTSLAVHWLRLSVLPMPGCEFSPGGGTKIPDAANHSLKNNNE